MSLLPLKTKFKGPAPIQRDETQVDIVDEALDFYRANVLFRNFEVQGGGDRILVYLTLYISQALTKLSNYDKKGAEQALNQLAIENFIIPGDDKFPLTGVVPIPKDRAEADAVRQYMTQLRQETGLRLVERVYAENPKAPSKWWTSWSKRKFLNRAL